MSEVTARPRDGGAVPVLQVLAAATLFGTTGTAQALGPSGTTPLGVGAARLVVGGAALVLVLPWVGGSRRAAGRLVLTRWGLLAGVMTAFYQVCFFAGVARAGVALGTLVTIGSGPVFTGLLSWVLLRERPGRAFVLATLLALAGLGLSPSTAPSGRASTSAGWCSRCSAASGTRCTPSPRSGSSTAGPRRRTS